MKGTSYIIASMQVILILKNYIKMFNRHKSSIWWIAKIKPGRPLQLSESNGTCLNPTPTKINKINR